MSTREAIGLILGMAIFIGVVIMILNDNKDNDNNTPKGI